LDTFQQLLGNFVSVTATSASIQKKATIQETGETIPRTGYDHIAVSGILATGVFANISIRGDYAGVGGSRFLWEIQGSEGFVRLVDNSDNSEALSWWPSIVDPLLYLNGELVPVKGTGLEGNVAAGWAEFVKGERGMHPTLDDAVKLHELLDAIQKSADEGVRIGV
jgi:predicted dehydrogenase